MDELKGWEKAIEDLCKRNSGIIKRSIENMDFDRLDRETAFLDEDPADFYLPRKLSFYETFKRYCALNT